MTNDLPLAKNIIYVFQRIGEIWILFTYQFLSIIYLQSAPPKEADVTNDTSTFIAATTDETAQGARNNARRCCSNGPSCYVCRLIAACPMCRCKKVFSPREPSAAPLRTAAFGAARGERTLTSRLECPLRYTAARTEMSGKRSSTLNI